MNSSDNSRFRYNHPGFLYRFLLFLLSYLAFRLPPLSAMQTIKDSSSITTAANGVYRTKYGDTQKLNSFNYRQMGTEHSNVSSV